MCIECVECKGTKSQEQHKPKPQILKKQMLEHHLQRPPTIRKVDLVFLYSEI